MIGQYRVRGKLGDGTFAEAFRVTGHDRTEYALKRNLIPGHPSHTERLRNEGRVLKRLDHPGIPTFVDAGTRDEPYIVMGLAPGRSLKDWIKSKTDVGAVHGDIETLQILGGLLTILSYLAEQGVVHRDVKADNILATDSASSVHLIDFGFAKAAGVDEISVDDSFWRAGAARYSPPRKLDNPGVANSSHDVFAAGVLGYLMLTGEYPWSVSSTQDVGSLRQLQQTRTPRSVVDQNPFARSEVSQLIMDLLSLDDARRPAAHVAAKRTASLLKTLSAGKRVQRAGRTPLPHISRDPLYGDIRLSGHEWDVLCTPEMQRLRGIKQLGLTNLVFSGAEHSRLGHAVGCVARVEQILRTIEDMEGVGVDSDTRRIARMYALIHDVTHVSFGHTIEDEMGIFDSHDHNDGRRRRLVLDSTSTLNRTLKQHEIGRAVLEHFDPEATIVMRSGITDLVSGSTGADVLDYIDRDALFCGLDHRVDSAIFRQFRWHRSRSNEPRLISLLHDRDGLRIDRQYAVESLLRERYAMFLKVYTHKTKTAASALLGKALTAALASSGRGKPDFDEKRYEWFADSELLARLKDSRKALPKELATELLRGSLPRGVYRAQLLPDGDRNYPSYQNRRELLREEGWTDPVQRAELEADLARQSGLDPAEVIVHCPSKAPGLQRVSHIVADNGTDTRALDRGHVAYRDVEVKHLGLWELRVFSRARSTDQDSALAGAVAERLGFDNMIGQDPRAGQLW